VANSLGVTQLRVRQWKDAGAPHDRRGRKIVFDPGRLREWLIDQGIAATPSQQEAAPATETIHRRRKDIANRFKVKVRAVSEWLEDPSFPGRAGTTDMKGQDGYFPEVKIAKWLVASEKFTPIPDDIRVLIEAEGQAGTSVQKERERYSRVKADIAELDLAERQGELIDADEVIRYAKRCVSYAVTAFNGIPAKVVASLPDRFGEAEKKLLHDMIREYVEHGLHHMHELLEADEDVEPSETEGME
jgi:phage terminase Nu1 subunit (DNA packaging protein)